MIHTHGTVLKSIQLTVYNQVLKALHVSEYVNNKISGFFSVLVSQSHPWPDSTAEHKIQSITA